MAISPPKPCAKTLCPRLTHRGARYCEVHAVDEVKVEVSTFGYDSRLSSTERGYGYKWQKARAIYLAAHPLCVDCKAMGLVVPATDVDHITPHRLGAAKASGSKSELSQAYKLFWKESNWQGLCKSCHSKKTARE